MKVIKLISNNIKRIKAVELTLDEKKNLVMITGKNAQGKSSVLDSIMYALGGKKSVPGKPIREGEENAEIELKVGSITVKRTFTDKGSYLTILNKEGSKFSNPQAVLDAIINNLAFDPLEFTRLDPDKQVKTLAKIVGLDLTEFDKKSKDLTEERKLLGREIKALATFTEEQVVAAQKTADENKNLPSFQEASAAYQAVHEKYVAKGAAEIKIKQNLQTITNLESQIATLKEENKKLAEYPTVSDEEMNKMKTDLDSLQSRANALLEAQRVIKENSKVAEKQQQYTAMTTQIEAIEAEKTKKLTEAKMPVPGLSWNETAVLFNGIPYNQISAAEQLRISLAIAMAMNPKLRVILIRDGSLLDSENLKLVEEMAKDKDFQVWVEAVDESGKVGIFIEDGEVKNINE